jgi:hypothetical protein
MSSPFMKNAGASNAPLCTTLSVFVLNQGASTALPQMNANAPRLYDPQRTCRRLFGGQKQKIPEAIQQRLLRHPRAWLQDDEPSAQLRRKSQHLAEIVVQSNEHPAFIGADIEQCFIRCTLETLVPHGHHIVTGYL